MTFLEIQPTKNLATMVIPTGEFLNGKYKKSEYFRRFIQPLTGSPLVVLHDQLIRPFKDSSVRFNIGDVVISEAEVGQTERERAADLVNYGYNSRYHRNHGSIVDLARDEFDTLSTTHTLVASCNVQNKPVVLGTFRIIDGYELDIFRLFSMRDGYRWPHEVDLEQPVKPGELGRFSLHPIFDVLEESSDAGVTVFFRQFQKLVLRKLWVYGMGKMNQEGVLVPYFILASKVREFVISAGIAPIQIEGEMASDSEYSRGIREKFSEYWKSHGTIEEQPKVYIAPWSLLPLDQVR